MEVYCPCCGKDGQEAHACAQCLDAFYCSAVCADKHQTAHNKTCAKQRSGRIFFEDYLMGNDRVFSEVFGRLLYEYDQVGNNKYILLVWQEEEIYLVKRQEANYKQDLGVDKLEVLVAYVHHPLLTKDSSIYYERTCTLSIAKLHTLVEVSGQGLSLDKPWVVKFI